MYLEKHTFSSHKLHYIAEEFSLKKLSIQNFWGFKTIDFLSRLTNKIEKLKLVNLLLTEKEVKTLTMKLKYCQLSNIRYMHLDGFRDVSPGAFIEFIKALARKSNL